MNIRLTLTLIIAKLLIILCRLTKRGGTTLPGKIARKLYPDIVKHISRDFKIIMVTGTNGKTTTTRIIGQILAENNIGYITNKSGANLVGGVITTFIEAVGIHGKSAHTTALIEIDEAAFNLISDTLEPDILVVTNFFRDQLDRYGELYSTLKGVASGISKSKKTKIILNADDSLCASLGKDSSREIVYYGLASDACASIEEVVNSDAMFCIFCKTKYTYTNHVYGHLGGFCCPNCGYRRPDTQVTCTSVDKLTSTYSEIQFTVHPSPLPVSQNPAGGERGSSPEICETEGCSLESGTWNAVPAPKIHTAQINLPGLYNVYNSLAGVACGMLLGLPVEKTIIALGRFECGFGRMETIHAQGKTIKLILVKNPTGFNQVLNFLQTEEKDMQLAFLINDNLADGTDISWLWDVDFEKLQALQEKLANIYTSGVRAEDMAVRLKYAGIYTNKISIIKNYDELMVTGLSCTPEGHSFYILPTYTAMLDIRKVLKKRFGLKEFWK